MDRGVATKPSKSPEFTLLAEVEVSVGTAVAHGGTCVGLGANTGPEDAGEVVDEACKTAVGGLEGSSTIGALATTDCNVRGACGATENNREAIFTRTSGRDVAMTDRQAGWREHEGQFWPQSIPCLLLPRDAHLNYTDTSLTHSYDWTTDMRVTQEVQPSLQPCDDWTATCLSLVDSGSQLITQGHTPIG